jgi:hypothetical protein
MRNIRHLRRRAFFFAASLLILLAAGTFDNKAWPQTTPAPQSPKPATEAKPILEVIQWSAVYGYDVGMPQPWYARDHRRFIYLRVFSDRTAEAQDEWDQTTKKTVLTQPEFDKLQYFVDRPDVLSLGLDAKYFLLNSLKFPASVKLRDSYQTWDAVLQHSKVQQKIQMADLDQYLADSGRYPQDAQKTVPNTVIKLGCTVEDLRASITGEKSGREKQCQEALAK